MILLRIPLLGPAINTAMSFGLKFWLLVVAFLAWALWFGGLLATFVFGLHFFKVLPHDTAADAANSMFESFAIYELALGAVTMIAAGLILVTFPSKRILIALVGLFLAGGMMITVTLGFMPEMKMLRADHQQNSNEFKRLHGRSMMAMTMQALVLAGTAVPLLAESDPWLGRRVRQANGFDPVLQKRSGLSRRI